MQAQEMKHAKDSGSHIVPNFVPVLRKKYCTTCLKDLDSIGWDHGFGFSVYDVHIGVRSTQLQVLGKLKANLPYASEMSNCRAVDRLFSILPVSSEGETIRRFNLYSDHLLIGQKLTLSDLRDLFESHATVAFAELSKKRLFVHAGVVAWQGKAILIPGKSHAGKSTLVRALVKHGADYFSDELAVFDEKGLVSAYPRPLLVRGRITSKQWPLNISTKNVAFDGKGIPVGLVVLTQYNKDARWQPRVVSSGNALLHLLENTHSAQRMPDRAIRVLKKVAIKARILTSDRGEADRVAQSLLEDMSENANSKK